MKGVCKQMNLSKIPFRIFAKIRRSLAGARNYLFCFVRGIVYDWSWTMIGLPIIERASGSDIFIGRNFKACSKSAANAIGVTQPCIIRTIAPKASICIGDDVGVSGCSIVAEREIRIGDRTLIGSGAMIVDTDFHPANPDMRRGGGE